MKFLNHPLRIESEELAFRGDLSLKKGDSDGATALYRQAAMKLGELLPQVPQELRRIRALFGRGVASLWFRVGDLDRAEQVCFSLLMQQDQLESDGVQDLRNMLDLVFRERELSGLGHDAKAIVPLELRLEGQRIARGLAPLDAVITREKSLLETIRRLTEHASGRPYRTAGKAPKDVWDQLTILTSTARAASFGIRVYLAPGPENQGDLSVSPQQIGDELLALSAAVQVGGSVGELANYLQPDYVRPLADTLRSLWPDGADVERVTLSMPSRMLYREPVMFPERGASDAQSGSKLSDPPVPEQIVGKMLGYDFSIRIPWIKVAEQPSNRVHTIHIHPSSFDADTAKHANSWVRVFIDEMRSRRPRRRLYAKAIEAYGSAKGA
ncbi:MAG: hypothetical protein M5U25_18830 [Planctomycetota bacterium]|nr:hypothetical protein [Planctomycetota bacterium]